MWGKLKDTFLTSVCRERAELTTQYLCSHSPFPNGFLQFSLRDCGLSVSAACGFSDYALL